MGLGLGLCCCGGCFSDLYAGDDYLTAEYEITISGLGGTCAFLNQTWTVTYLAGTPPGFINYWGTDGTGSLLFQFVETTGIVSIFLCTGNDVPCQDCTITFACSDADGSLEHPILCSGFCTGCTPCDPLTSLDVVTAVVTRTA